MIDIKKPGVLFKLPRSEESSLILKLLYAFENFINTIYKKDSPIALELIQEFQERTKNFPVKLQKILLNQLNKISEDEVALMQLVKERIDASTSVDHQDELFFQFFMGGYFIFDDNGEAFKTLRLLPTCVERTSSHESDDTQYEICGQFLKSGLISRKQYTDELGKTRTVTWLQCERYPVTLANLLPHLWCYLLYKVSGKNQGPYGTSIHREKSDPIILKF